MGKVTEFADRRMPYMYSRLQPCAIDGCDGWACEGEEACEKCAAEIAGLDEMVKSPAKRRLESFVYASAAVAVMLWLGWETRSFWMEWAQMVGGVFGSGR
jgi:hypothetical protein